MVVTMCRTGTTTGKTIVITAGRVFPGAAGALTPEWEAGSLPFGRN